MKISRKTLLIIITAMGLFIIVYSLIRHFTGIGLEESAEKFMMDIVIITALGLFFYNRKLVGDEKRAKEAKEAAEKAKIEEAEAAKEEPAEEDENLPHWER